ncbi:MAG: Abi family protein [Alphaproteobacteria bacterium]
MIKKPLCFEKPPLSISDQINLLRIRGLRPKERFIEHYRNKYSYPELPPSWMIFETLSFGDISVLFKNLLGCHKKQIANSFDQDDKILSSWMHSLCFLRNLCAHHSRIWNREMSITPKIAKRHQFIQTLGKNHYFFGIAVVIKIILDKIDSENSWDFLLTALIKEFPNINTAHMGFPQEWQGAISELEPQQRVEIYEKVLSG